MAPKFKATANHRADTRIAELVPDIFDDVASMSSRSTGESSEPIPEGQRDITLTRLAGSMRRKGLSQEAIAAALHIENERCCQS